jgi:hypothetical protein
MLEFSRPNLSGKSLLGVKVIFTDMTLMFPLGYIRSGDNYFPGFNIFANRAMGSKPTLCYRNISSNLTA